MVTLTNPVYFDLVGVVVSLFGSAFFSGSETALTALSQGQIERLIESEGVGALELWRDRPIEVLTTVLIGNNLVNITASALATRAADNLVDQGAVPLAVGVMTFLLLTFGEITPKTFAKQWSVRLAGPIMSVMRAVYYVFYPFTMLFTRMTRAFMTVLGNDPDEQLSYAASEELEYLVDVGSRDGSISEEREKMLRSVFEFPETIVREVMVPRTDMVAISVDMELDTIVDILVDCGHSRIPVYGENLDEIRGLFYAKDLIRLAKSDAGRFDIDDLIREPYFVPESKRIAPLLSEFQAERIHMAVVVDEFGGTEGLITLEDIIEEFFGDIKDEYDSESPPIQWTGDGTATVDARMPVDEVEDEFDTELPVRPDYESLGGFLLDRAGDVPDVDSEIEWEHLTFRVLEADPKRVQTVEVEVGEPVEEGAGGDDGEGGGRADADTDPEVSEASW